MYILMLGSLNDAHLITRAEMPFTTVCSIGPGKATDRRTDVQTQRPCSSWTSRWISSNNALALIVQMFHCEE
jgi:hypothetical protein